MAEKLDATMSPFKQAVQSEPTVEVEHTLTPNATQEEPTVSKKGAGRPLASTPDWAPLFLSAIITGMHVTHATKLAGVNPSLPYIRRKTDEEFRQAWREAAQVGTALLEEEAAPCAFHGTLEPVFHKGVQVGTIRKYSDTLLIFLLKARKPEVYRDVRDAMIDGRAVTLNVQVVNVGENSGPLPSRPVEQPSVASAIMIAEQLPTVEQVPMIDTVVIPKT